MTSKKSQKIQEFVANDSAVTSSSFGHKSGQVMAIGGEDGSLSVWHIGSTNCLMSLPPLSAPVESIKFDQSEEIICVGARSGCLRIYNLSTSKVLKTLSGHKAAIRCIDFHPYGDFLASCSDDHKVRMWDVRRKGCIYTYKDHSDKVNQVQFSPDGKWIAATSDDHTCKIWDLTAGKLLHELKDHSGSVKCLQFHPREFLLATGSTDRTTNVYDVEQFKLLTTSPLESNPIEKVAFADSGVHLYTASQDCFKMYSWEPKCMHLDTVLVKWGKPADIFVSKETLMGCSYNQNIVAVHSVDLNALNYNPSTANYPTTPRTAVITDHGGVKGSPRRHSQSKATKRQSSYSPSRSTTNHRTITRSSSQSKEMQQPSNVPQIHYPQGPVEDKFVFVPQNTLARSPTRDLQLANIAAAVSSSNTSSNNHHLYPEAAGEGKDTSSKKNQQQLRPQTTVKLAANFHNIKIADSSTTTSSDHQQQFVPTPSGQPVVTNAAEPAPVVASTPSLQPSNGGGKSPAPASSEPLGGAFNWKNPTPQPPQEQFIPPEKTHQQPPVVKPLNTTADNIKIATVVPMERQNPAGLDMNAFLPVRKPVMDMEAPPLNDLCVIDEIRKGSGTMKRVLKDRHKNLEVVRAVWSSGDVMTAINTVVRMHDQSLVIDLLNVLNIKPSLWNLDMCTLMLPNIKDLIVSRYETYVNVGCDSLRLVLKNFAQVIRSNLQPPPYSAIDLSREERHNKCKECYAVLQQIRSALESKQQISGKLGSRFRELKILIRGVE